MSIWMTHVDSDTLHDYSAVSRRFFKKMFHKFWRHYHKQECRKALNEISSEIRTADNLSFGVQTNRE